MRPVLVALGLLLFTACEAEQILHVEVTLSPTFQEGLGEEDWPIQVAFESDDHIGQSKVVCQAQASDRVVTLIGEEFGCPREAEVRVAVGPFPEPYTGCVDLDPGSGYANTAAEAYATTTGTAFVGLSETPCTSEEDTVAVTF